MATLLPRPIGLAQTLFLKNGSKVNGVLLIPYYLEAHKYAFISDTLILIMFNKINKPYSNNFDLFYFVGI